MTSKQEEEKFQQWLKDRPAGVRKLAEKYLLRPGEKLGDFWFLGYGEYDDGSVGLIISPRDPRANYHEAIESRTEVCSSCVDKFLRDVGVLQ